MKILGNELRMEWLRKKIAYLKLWNTMDRLKADGLNGDRWKEHMYDDYVDKWGVFE